MNNKSGLVEHTSAVNTLFHVKMLIHPNQGVDPIGGTQSRAIENRRL